MPAEIEKPVLPRRLYRYRSFTPRVSDDLKESVLVKREIDSIREPYLWCANFEHMNDPMEGVFRPSTRLNASPELKKI